MSKLVFSLELLKKTQMISITNMLTILPDFFNFQSFNYALGNYQENRNTC